MNQTHNENSPGPGKGEPGKSEPGRTFENMVSYSEELLTISIGRLTALMGSYDDPKPGLGKDLAEEFRGLRKALEIAYHERANLQKLKGSETAAGAALDLDGARAEIQCRLDRLRAAEDRDRVS